MSKSDAGGSAKTCFVAMPITTPATYAEKLGDPEHFAHVLTHLFTPALQGAGLTVIAPAVIGAEMIHAEIIRNLEQADFVLCDLSDLNPNVLFELGIRTSLDRPVMLVRDNLTDKIPFDLNAINTTIYDSSLTPWSLTVEIPRLTSFIQGVVNSGNPGNPMWRYFGLTKRGTPSEAGDNPIEAKLDLLVREMAKYQPSQVPHPVQDGSSQSGSTLKVWISSVLARYGIDKFDYNVRTTTGEPTLRIIIPKSAALPLEKTGEVEELILDGSHGIKQVDIYVDPSL